MKVKQLTIHNIGMIPQMDISFDKPLLLFYGEIMQGKTTILNAVKLCFGGAFPSDVIRHGENEAYVQLTFDNATIRREFYVSGESTVVARPISFVRDGEIVKKPVEAIKEFLNPFLLDQNYLFNMTELERTKYFIDLFGVNTATLDAEYKTLEAEAKDLRATIKGYGEVDLTPVEKVDVTALKEEFFRITQEHSQKVETIRATNSTAATRKHNRTTATEKLSEIDAQIAALQTKKVEIETWMQSNPELTMAEEPAAPDTSELQSKIENAAAQNVRHEQFLLNTNRHKEKVEKENLLRTKEARQRDIKKEKAAALKSISDNCGIPSLSFDEEGNFMYDNTQAGMLSTSQLMKLSSELSAKYPEGFGLELIDRGESLGKSIFEFVKKAESEEKTILATIVGERPADVPDNIGVFVVEDGQIK
jgi:DNA repair ATPase RecN